MQFIVTDLARPYMERNARDCEAVAVRMRVMDHHRVLAGILNFDKVTAVKRENGIDDPY